MTGKRGKPLGEGSNKEVFSYTDDDNLALAVSKPGKPAGAIMEQIGILKQIEAEGLPAVRVYEEVTDSGRPGMLMERLEEGSKNVVKTVNRKPTIVGESKFLNQKSIDDLRAIQRLMEEKKLRINDLQLGISSDGTVKIIGPRGLQKGIGPSPENIQTIRKLIEAAQKRLKND